MRNPIESFIAPLSPEPDTAYREYLLNSMLIILISASAFFQLLAIVLWTTGQVDLSAIIGGGAILLTNLLAYRLSRQQKITFSAYLTIGILFLTILMITVFSGVGHPNILGFVIVAMMSAILLGMKIAILSVLLIVTAYGLCGYAQVTDRLPTVLSVNEAWLMDLSGMGIGLMALAIFGWLATKTLYTSLHRERDLTAKLTDQSSHLEDMVIQRTATLSRTNNFLSALSQIAARLEVNSDLDHVLTTLDDELKKLELNYFFAVLNPDTDELTARYVSIHPKALAMAEKLAGLTLQDFRVPIAQWFGWDEIKKGQGVYSTDTINVYSLILPNISPFVWHRILKLTGVGVQTPVIILPLRVEQQITGTLSVWGKDLVRDDVSTLSIFANQVAVTLEKNRLYQEAASLKRFNESIVQGVAEAIIIEGPEGVITFANTEAHKLLGYAPKELVGKHWTLIVPEIDHTVVHGEIVKRPQGIHSRYEINLQNSVGVSVPVMVSATPMFDGENYVGTLSAFIDITERKQAEEQIKVSLKEKEVMLQEIHHRVKNNLQVIASLLSLQSGYVEHPQALEIFKESEQRIRSMALIHEKLYRSENLARIDLAEYINDLSTYLFRSHKAASRGIKLNLQTRHVLLSIDTAVPCGLILNELISNALKHAFPLENGTSNHEILINLDSFSDKVSLRIADNGVGFPKDIDFQNTASLGLKIVNSLVTQLDGNIELFNQTGTEFQIIFSVEI